MVTFLHNQCQTRDVDEHASCLLGWGQRYDQLSSGAFAGEFEEFCFGEVQIFRERLNQAVHESGAPAAGRQSVAVASGLDGEGWFNGEAFRKDSVLMLHGGERFDFRAPSQHEMLAATVNTAALHDYARRVEQRDLSAEFGPGLLPCPDLVRATAYRAFLTTLCASLRATPQMLDHAPLQRALAEAVYGAIISALGDEAAPARLAPPTHTRRLIVERAREYVHTHSSTPISVADLCTALGVSRHTLQYSFQEVLDLNPMKFLRAMRLNGVRRDLRAADPALDTVGDIAARWGFWHLSHFAADYKEMFGELPSDTLRQ
ncbi:AraC family transcriptional regulator [Betaproteobacteria bacterium]|nr:AraC family transcriptional regulator [Betaproteobacteria bacterium]GHT99379.1 AraC family transcriptional regulator [Betaproteobacteria bacterium]GHU11728.1 AraC family transcriptional regulator [Betaproteobacteria bacterium]GHU23271.1 AraC family transcriptional regulator [Betaproteobacteria bacterium]GHU26982.1 AraC family transcriptional regulator [Betaproteobacteria bacterium]